MRDSPVYLGIKGKVLVQKGDLEEAVSVLEAGLALPGVRAPARGVPPVPLPDRSAIFVQACVACLRVWCGLCAVVRCAVVWGMAGWGVLW